jgi:peptide/nickel transport system substrate-binding protein
MSGEEKSRNNGGRIVDAVYLSRRGMVRLGAGAAGALTLSGLLEAVAAAEGGRPAARSGARFQDTPQPGGTLIVGLKTEPDNIDPHVTPYAVSHNVMMNIFDTLVWQDPADGSFKPGLATSWEVAPDATSYTFTLRTDVVFHDGTPFNADAVKFSFDRIANPETKSGFSANLLGPYAGTEVIDPATIRVTFTEPYAPFLDSASQAFLAIVSPAGVEQYGLADFGHNPVGSGPFVFKEWVVKDHLTLTKNPDYNWPGGVFAHTGPAYVDEITFRFIAEDLTRTGTLESGESNVIEFVTESDIERLTGEGYQILPGKAPGIPSIVMLNTAKPPTDDINVRKAMLMGTDHQSIIDTIYFGVFERAEGPQAKVSWVYNPEVEGMYSYDPEGAIALLEEAGWVLNGDFREKDGQKLSLIFPITTWQLYAELWQAQMRDIGIEIQIQRVDPSVELEIPTNGECHVSSIGWISSDPVILEHLFHSKNIGTGFSWSRYVDAHLDELLVQGSGQADQAARKQTYGEVQMIVMQQALIIPLFDQIAYNGIRSEVHDVKVDARGWYRWFYDAWISE